MSRARRHRSDINTLNISLGVAEVTFEFVAHGQSLFRLDTTTDEIGLKPSFEDMGRYNYREPEFSLPEGLFENLSKCQDHLKPDDPLWLDLAPPGSRLIFIPWERLLSPRISAPILRLPFYHLLAPIPVWDTVDVVVCASAPIAKDSVPIGGIVDQFARRILEAAEKQTVIHVFTDVDSYEGLKYHVKDLITSDRRGVKLYDPNTASGFAPAERSKAIVDDPEHLHSPWLNWMADSLSGLSVDIVHFICHGFLSMNQGALAFAESPLKNEDPLWSRFVGASQLNNFLNRVCAWSVAFSSPRRNFSVTGLRVLTEQVARLRSGPILMHEISGDDELKELAHIYHYLYCDYGHEPPLSDWLSFYCPPSLFRNRLLSQRASHPEGIPRAHEGGIFGSNDLMRLLAKGQGDESREAVRPWIANSYRWIEQTASELVEVPASERQTAIKEGVENALKFISDVVQRHAGLKGGPTG